MAVAIKNQSQNYLALCSSYSQSLVVVCCTVSVEHVAQIVVAEQLDVLFVGNTEAVEKIVNVRLAEQGRVFELGQIGVNLVVVFNGFNNVTLSIHFKHLLGDHSMRVVKGYVDVGDVAIRPVEVSRVAECTLVVRDRPGGCRHNAEVVVAIGDHAANKCVLSRHIGLADW